MTRQPLPVPHPLSSVARPTVLLFVRDPVLGQVKTRLAAGIGDEAALAVYRHLGRETARLLGASSAWDLEVQVASAPAAEDEALERVARWLEGCGVHRLVPQAGGDLGARMHRALTASLARGAGAAVVVASDVPALTTPAGVKEVVRGLGALATDAADLVLGPSPDGGYWLVGVTRPRPRLFSDLPWSTPEVLPRTLAVAAAEGLRVVLLDSHADVDVAQDLERLPARERRLTLTGPRKKSPRKEEIPSLVAPRRDG